MLKADHKYHGKVRPGSEMIESESGTLGFQVQLECEDGNASYTIWITNKNRDRAVKTFTEALGVLEEKLHNSVYVENQLGLDITGREVTFVTAEEEYKGKSRIKVAWLFKRSASGGGNPAKAAANFFANKKAPVADLIMDDDIPF